MTDTKPSPIELFKRLAERARGRIMVLEARLVHEPEGAWDGMIGDADGDLSDLRELAEMMPHHYEESSTTKFCRVEECHRAACLKAVKGEKSGKAK